MRHFKKGAVQEQAEKLLTFVGTCLLMRGVGPKWFTELWTASAEDFIENGEIVQRVVVRERAVTSSDDYLDAKDWDWEREENVLPS